MNIASETMAALVKFDLGGVLDIASETMAALVKFDLGGVLDIAFGIDFDDDSSWILFGAEGWNVSHSSRDGFDVERG